MNYHSRSYSEQPQATAQSTVVASGVNTNGPQPQSFIRIHSDSKQSLDQLFNPTQNSVPLRNRNLPPSFFNPSAKNEPPSNSTDGQPAQNSPRPASLHHRSISFDHQNQPVRDTMRLQRQNLHMRTHSTLAPMPRLVSNNSSQQSSREYLNQEAATSLEPNFAMDVASPNQQHNLHQNSNSNSGWSSAANSIDNLNSSGWTTSQPCLNHDMSNQAIAQTQAIPANQNMACNMLQPATMSPAHSQQNVFYNGNGTTQSTAHQTGPPNHHPCTNNLHSRSMSFNPNPADMNASHHGFHARTHSTVAPMVSSSSISCGQHTSSNHSLHRSSQDLNYQSSSINTSSAAGWSSSGYSTDDMTTGGGGGGGHGWISGHPQQQPQPQPQIQPLHQQQPAQPHASIQQAGPMIVEKSMQPNSHNHLNSHGHYLQHHHHHHHHMQTQSQHQQHHQQHQQLFYHV